MDTNETGPKNTTGKSPYELGRASAGADVENPFGQYAGNEQGTGSDTAWDEWEDGRADAEQEAGEAYAETFDRSMRDVYHPDEG